MSIVQKTASPTNPEVLQILWLSEGFTSSNTFFSQCAAITDALLKIPPFNTLKDRIGAWARFDESQAQGIGSDPANPSGFYGFYKIDRRRAVTQRLDKILASVKDTRIAPVPCSGQAELGVTGEEIWLNQTFPSTAIVCVLIDDKDKIGCTFLDLNPFKDLAPEVAADARLLIPFVILSNSRVVSGAYNNPFDAQAAVLAHELGHAFGLGDENEEDGAKYATYDVTDPSTGKLVEIDRPNVATVASFTREDGTLDPGRIKWRSLISANRLSRIVKMQHPEGPTETEDDWLHYAEFPKLAADSVVLLLHPEDQGDVANTTHYVDGGRKRLWQTEPNLLEGGYLYRKGVVRPTAECLMRIDGYDGSGRAPVQRHRFDFCVVCMEHLHRVLDALPSFRLGSPRIISGAPLTLGRELPSRLAQEFVKYIETHPLPGASGTLLCVEATMLRFERFFNTMLRWPDTTTIGAPANWYSSAIPLPNARGLAHVFWDIWMSVVEHLRSPALSNYAGMGAAGAIWYNGLGALANRRRRVRQALPDGRVDVYHQAQNLSAAELDNLAPGSLIQVWSDEEEYSKAVRYARGLSEDLPSAGHSLIYMGKKNGEPVAADQFRLDQPLTSGWVAHYGFRVAAQFFDAVWTRTA